MKKGILFFISIVLTAGFVLIACTDSNKGARLSEISNDSLIKRGEYLVATIGCGDCHSPKVMTAMGPVPDTTRLLSGHRSDAKMPPVNEAALKEGWVLFYPENTAMVSPLGISYAANITSDSTGIGNWTFNQFVIAMTKGKYKGLEGSRNLLPPMPWPNFAHMSNDDLKSIYAYLKSTKPVNNIVPVAQINL
ncbi:MAG: diheme cytochrome c-553 [Lacibacter sp.]